MTTDGGGSGGGEPGEGEPGGGEPGLEVAVTTVGPRRRDRRATIVAGAVVAVVAVGIGLSRIGQPPAPSPSLVARAPSPTLGGAPVRPTDSPEPGPPQELLPIDNVALPGAPTPLVVTRSGADLVLTTWQPGTGLVRAPAFEGALRPDPALPENPLVSPDGHAVLVVQQDGGVAGNEDSARVVVEDHGVVWETASAEGGGIGGVWSADSRRVIVGGSFGTWHVVTISPDGTAVGQTVTIELPEDRPGRPDNPTIEPVAFSEDGAWMYGVLVTEGESDTRSTFRVRADGTGTELVDRWPLQGPDRPAPFPDWLVDPSSGRTSRFNALPDGRSLDVLEPDGSTAFTVGDGFVLGSSWIGDGTLLAAIGDITQPPSEVSFERFAPDGDRSLVLRTGPIEGAAYIGSRNGFVGLGILVREPAVVAQLVLVRLDDLEMTAVRIESGADDIVGLGWAP